MTIWLLLFVLLLDRGASKTALLDDGTCPAGWDSMGDVCLQPHLEPKETVEAAKHCRKKGAKLLECPVVQDDVIELLSSLFEKGIEESTWLIAPREEGPIALRRSANGSYNILNLPSVATFPFLCSLTPVGRRSALLQQQLTARGAPQLHWNTPREIYFHARPDADFIPLPCRVTAQPPARIIWFKNDLQIISGNDSLLVSGGTLLVPATSSLAYSTFHCIGTNKYGKVRSPSVVLKPAFIEPFPPNRQDAVPLAHGGARLQCQTAHQPKSQSFTWLLGSTNRPVLTDERVFISREGSLLFANVGPDDDARYACFLSLSSTASGHYGPFFRLRVLSPQPQFKPRIDPSYPLIFPENAVAGDTIYVECFAYANPVAMYSWNRVDGKPFSPRVTVTNHGRVLRIDKAQRSDAGRLRCSTTNSLGASTAEINLVLKGPAPVILLPLTDLVVATEEDFSLECVLSSSDLYSSVEWFKDGTPVVPLLMPPSQRKRFKVNENKLSVISVQALDTGTYQCVIGNDVGVTTSSAHVSVKDVVPNFPATVMPQKVFANIGSNVSIPCIYQASPRGHSRWTSDGGARIPSKGRVREEDGTLFIDHVLPDDQGHFFCIARNRIGRANSQVQLIVVETTLKKNRPWTGNFSCEIEWECKDKACQDFKDAETKKKLPCSSALGAASALLPAPIGLRVENMTHGLRLAWRMPPHGRETRDHQKNDVKGFLVEMRTKDDRQWKAAPRGVVKATDADGLLLEDLVSNQQYQFRIRSVGTSFVGDASSPSSWVKTPASPPQESVEDLRWKALDPTRLLIEWEPLDEQAGDNLRYVVSWSEAAQHDPAPTFFAHRVESNLPQTVIRLNSTNGCRAVTLAVRAENDQGTADVSTETVALVRGAGHPGRLTEEAVEVLNATHIRLSWKWSDAGDCAAPRVVKISCDSEGQATVNLTTSGENSEWVVGNLHPSTDYNCFLTPSDTSGHQGETTNPLVLRTMVAPPSEAPLIIDWALKPSDKHDFTTVLEWRAVDHGNDTVENCGYDIFVFISETANEAVILRMPLVKLTDHQKPSARIDGLRLMYLYTIQVSAYNSGGQGPRSTPRVIRLGSRRDELSNASHISVIFILIFCLCQ